MKIHRATISKVVYRIDVGRTDSEVLPLGLLVCFAGEDGTGSNVLMLVAKTKLKKAELEKLDWIAQRKLANPATYLQSVVDAARTANAPDVLSYVSEHLRWSVQVSAPVEVPLSDQLADQLEAALHQPEATPVTPSIVATSRPARHTRKAGPVIPGKASYQASAKGKKAIQAFARLAAPDFTGATLDVQPFMRVPAWLAAGASARSH